MSSTRYFLAGAAIIAGGFYYYDLQVQQVALKRKEQHGGILSSFNQDTSTDLRQLGAEKGYKIGDKLENLKSEADKQLNDLKIPQTINSTFSEVEKKKSELTSTLAEKAKDFSNFASDKASQYETQSKALIDEAKKNEPSDGVFTNLFKAIDEDKNLLVQLGDKYIDLINRVGITAHNTVASEKLALDDTRAQLERDYNDASEKVGKKVDSWFSWGRAKKQEVDYHAAKTKESALKQYNQAKKDLEAAQKDLASESDKWLKWGEKKSDKLKAEAEKRVNDTQAKFNEASSSLQSFGRNLVPSDSRSISEEELARRSFDALRGWGESAASFAAEELETIESHRLKHPRDINWTDDVWNKTENLSKHAYESAKSNYHNLVAQVENQTKKTSNWFSSQSKDIEKASNQASDDFQKELDEAKRQLDKAQANFNSWLDKSGKTIVDYSTDAIDVTKKNLHATNAEAQRQLTEGKKWLQEKK